MREGYFRGIAWRLPLIGAVLCACAVSMPVHAQPAAGRTVGLHITVPGDARDAKEAGRVGEIKAYLEGLIKQQLEALGLEVRVKPASSRSSRTVAGPDPWARDNSVQYFLTGELLAPFGDERTFVWRVRNEREADPKAKSRGPVSEEHQRQINNVDSKRTGEDLRNAALQVRDVFARGFGISRTKRVLVSCFQIVSLPKVRSDAETLQMLEMSLPNQLAAYLHEFLAKKGYETLGLDPTQIRAFCKFEANAANVRGSLEDQKEKADCVIQGVISMSGQESVEVTFATTWGRVAVPPMDKFVERIDERRITEVMAKFIVDRWQRIERAQ